MITRGKISAVRVNSFVVVEQFSTFSWLYGIPRISTASGVRRLFEGGAYSRAALINFFIPDAALNRGQCLFE